MKMCILAIKDNILTLFVKDKKILESSYSSGILEKPKTIVFVASHAWKHCLLIWRSTSCRQRKSKQPKWLPIWLPSNSKVNFMRIVVKKSRRRGKNNFWEANHTEAFLTWISPKEEKFLWNVLVWNGTPCIYTIIHSTWLDLENTHILYTTTYYAFITYIFW